MATLQITFVSESAGYENVLGWYNSRTGEAGIIFINTNDDGPNAGISAGTTATLEVDQADIDAGYIGFFVIPNGADIYGTGEDSVLNGPLTFDTKPNGDGQILDADGKKLRGEQTEIIFTDPELNKHDADYTSAHTGRQKLGDLGSDDADGITGTIAFEDLVRHSDRDYNDLVIDVQVLPDNQPPVVEDQVFLIDENSAAGTAVGAVLATDPDAGQTLSYAIVGGNDSGAFAINTATGEITVADASKLDFEDPDLDSYDLTVQVTDNGTGALSDTATVRIQVANVIETLQGQALDGYVAGATVFADADEDGVLDAGEANAITDLSGNFTLVDGSGPLVMVGGTDIATGLPFAGMLRAPEGATVVTPLTTLVAALVDHGQSVDDASANVAGALGLDGLLVAGQAVDLLNFDPIPDALAGGADGDAAAQVLAAGIQVQNSIVQITALLSGAGATDAQAAVVAALGSLLSSGAPVNLEDPAVLEALINSSAENAAGVSPADIAAVADDAAQVLAATNSEVSDALAGGSGPMVLESLAQAASVAQGPALAQALAQAGDANEPGTLVNDYTGASLEAKVDNAPVGDIDGGTVGTPGDDVLAGGPGNDVIDGLGGNDQLSGLDGNDQLIGGEGDDTLFGNLGNDLLRGGAGNDILDGGVVADLQSDIGFRDTDRADYGEASGGVNVNLASGIAQDGDGGTDTLIGVEGVIGSAHDDVLTGGSGAFVESFRGGPGNDTIDGGSWNDRAEYVDATAGISVTPVPLAPNMRTVTGDASVGTDTLSNVEIVYGTDFADTYVATGFLSASQPGGILSNFNSFEGRGGNDTITGNGGTRIEFTGATAGVTVNLATGTATGDASVGTDSFSGVNSVRGSSFADTLRGDNPFLNGFESFDGRGGNDLIEGGQGYDLAVYTFDGAITTGITVNLAAGTVTGDPILTGTDTLRGVEGVRGSHKDDWYDATGFDAFSLNAGSLGPSGTYNDFEGAAGNDTIIGNGNTRIIYTQAREGVSVDLAAGTAVGGASVGTDTMLGGVWAVRGSNFNDVLAGSAASEYFEGRAGDDAIDGGGGFDAAAYDVGASGGGTFIANPLGAFTATAPGLGTDALSNIVQITGTNFGDLFDGSASSHGYSFVALGGNDTLTGSQGLDNLFGGDGNDVLVGGTGSDLMDGGPGNDHADYSGAGNAISVDLVFGSASDNLGGFGSGFDTLLNIENVTGTGFNDTLLGNFANNVLAGGSGNDFLRGAGGNDVLDGGIVADLQSDAGWRDIDRADYSNAFFGVDVNLGSGIAFDGEGGMDSLSGIESVNGSAFDDILTGSSTTFSENFHGGAGNDTIHGAGGFDRAEYQDAMSGLWISLGGFGDSSGTVSGDFSVGFDTLTGVEQFTGSSYADTFTVGWFMSDSSPGGFLSNFNAFEGREGDDVINGNGGTRIEYSSAFSAVSVNLATGIAAGDFSVGTDTFTGANSVRGSAFNDTLTGGNPFSNGLESFDGRGGDDFMDGGQGWDRADYGFNGAVTTGITVNLAAGTANGDPLLTGSDTLRGIEAVRGTHLADFYDATGFSGFSTNAGWNGTLNEFEGMAGDDTIVGNGNTRVSYSFAREGVSVDLQAGTAVGGASVGTDTLMGGISEMRGSNFDDALLGTSHGINSVQVYEGRAGNDSFSGRGGFDQARYNSDPTQAGIAVDMATAAGSNIGTVTGDLWIGTDTLIDIASVVGTFFNDFYDATGYNSTLSGLGTFNEFEGGFGDDTIIGNGNTRIAFLNAGAGVTVDLNTGTASGGASGNDTFSGVNAVRGSFSDDAFTGSAANETFEGRGGNDAIHGGGGFDLARYDLGSIGAGTFLANALGGFSASALGLGNDTLTGIESIRGTSFGDLFDGSASALGYTFDGRGGDDTLIGSQGNDTLLGGDGSDLLRGGQGADFIDGGMGADRIDFDNLSEAGDTIAGFEAVSGGDVLDIADLLQNSTTYAGGAGGPLATFVQLQAIGPDAQLQIDTDGIAGPAFWQPLATLLGGAGLTLDSLVANGNLDIGPAGGSTIFGTPGNDFLVGTPGNDTIHADLGNDTLRGGAGDDVLDGGVIADLQSDVGFRDTDRADYSTAMVGVIVNLATGTAQDGEGGTDTLTGIEAVTGSAFDDSFTGSDIFVEFFRGGAGNDTIDGAGGNDRAEYVDAASSVAIAAAGGGSAVFTVTGDPSVGTDSLTGVELFSGSDAADTYNALGFLSASGFGGFASNFNAFEGRGGNDGITGNGGTRIEFTSATGGVTVDLAAGTATGDGSVGFDTFTGVNSVRGSASADTLLGGNLATNGFESFEGRGGDDFIDGKSGFDRADYGVNGPLAFGISVDLADGIVTGDALVGTDTLRSVEAVRGTYLADFYDATGFSNLSLNAGSSGTFNEFEGMGGNDTITGNGSTRVSYAGAREAVSVNLATGSSSGGTSTGSDNFTGVNAARGSNFDDTLIGSAGNDSLLGGEGSDLLRGGLGADFIDGGNGSDRIDFDSLADAGDTIQGFAAFPGGDVLDLADLLASSTSYAGGAGGPLADFVKIEVSGSNGLLQIDTDGLSGPAFWQPLATLLGGAGLTVEALVANGNLDVGPAGGGGVTLIGTPGNDSLIGGPGNDTLVGGLGNDFLQGGGGSDLLDGGVIQDLQSDGGFRDSDRVDYSTAPAGVDVNLASGIAYDGAGGIDTLIGIEGVGGSPFDDVFTGSSTFAENFFGGAGNDTIFGGGGFDFAQYFNASSGVSISVGGFGGFSTATGTVSGDASVGSDSLFEVEQFGGSNFGDTFTVGLFLSASQPGGFLSNFNSFEGRGGNDTITGNGGTRIEYAGATGAVNVDLFAGLATGDASVGTDNFSGVNQVRGSSFADTLLGGNPLSLDLESFDGRGGNDWIDGASGWDRADYAFNGPAMFGITANLAAGTVQGDPTLTGTDTLRSVEAIRGTHLADFYDATGFSGSSTNAGMYGTLNEFEGMAGNDTITGNGNTRASYAFAREGVSVDMQVGETVGGASVGTDNFTGVNAVRGSNFDDVLAGSVGDDILEGGLGNDLLHGGAGADLIDSGAGSDRIDFDSLLDASDTIANFDAVPGGDVLDIADLLAFGTGYAGGAGGPLADFVRVETAGVDAQLQIDADGSAGGPNWQTLATLLGDAGLDLDTLLTNGNLDIVI